MDAFESLGDPKKLLQYLLTTIGLFIAMIILFIFTMDDELKIYFYVLLVMLGIFMILLMYLSPIIFADRKIIKNEEIKENEKKEKKEKKENNLQDEKLKKD